MTDIRTIFKSVSKVRHEVNVQRDSIILTENMHKNSEVKKAKRKAAIASAAAAKAKRNLPFAGDIPLNDIILPPGTSWTHN